MDDSLIFNFYEGSIPAALLEKLPDLYNSPYATYEYVSIFSDHKQINALQLLNKQEETVHLVLYSVTGKDLEILLSLCLLDQPIMQDLCSLFFARYPDISQIRVIDILSHYTRGAFPFYLLRKLAVYAIFLPETIEQYNKGLSKNMLYQFKRAKSTLLRDFKGYTFEILEKSAIKDVLLQQVFAWNRLRMTEKNQESTLSEAQGRRIFQMVMIYGYVGVLRVGERVVAATICYKTGNHVAAVTGSHDQSFNKYCPGLLCDYFTILRCIESGFRVFNYLWDEYTYKTRLLAKPLYAYRFIIFRSRWCQLFSLSSMMTICKHRVQNVLRNLRSHYRNKSTS